MPRKKQHAELQEVEKILTSPTLPSVPASQVIGNVLAPKEAALLEGLINGKTPTEAVKSAGYACASPESAVAIAKHVRNKHVDNNGALMVALDRHGVNVDTLARKVSEGLEATTPIRSGRTVIGHAPDFGMRHKYIETTLDIVGGRAPTRQIVESVTTHEKTVAIVEGVRGNPNVLAALHKRMEQRTITMTETTAEVCDAGDE